MAVDLVLTKHIQEAIVEALQSKYLPHDLEKQLSQYTGECLDKDESNSTEKKISVIPFKLVKRLWECHSEHVGAGKRKRFKLLLNHRIPRK